MQAVLADLGEELLVALLTSKEAREQDPGAVDGEQGADAVELGREDLEHHQRKGELAQRGAYVGSFERSLRRPYLDEFVIRQHHRSSSMRP